MNIETAIAEIDAFVRRNYTIVVLDAWAEFLAEYYQLREQLTSKDAEVERLQALVMRHREALT